MDAILTNLINSIWDIKSANRFPNYIDYIQFPFFRNIELDQRINFDFPLTAFIGPNGSGKSSTLHALYGCPDGKTPYDFWFSSEVDPVEYQLKGSSLRHSFFYGFKDEKRNELQVVKARIRRENNPNYWETSRPLLSYGMVKAPYGKERNDPIKKEVVYIDFRSELSAFDKYFYFETPPSYLINNRKQEYIRYKSRILRNIFNQIYEVAKDSVAEPLNEKLIFMDENELAIVSDILSREYSEIKILKHRIFHNWGYSVKLKTKFHEYSEAFSGSGELAIIRLVQKILNAKSGSLILLDEPEVSLHPGAQKRLKEFLLDQIKINKHQIIISTHSPTLIDGLPKEAIKVFTQKIDSGKFIIKENIYPEEAFYFIGQEISGKIVIIVEDNLAKKILDRTLSKLGVEVNNLFDVKIMPGGASAIQQQITTFANTNADNYFFLLDGDQNKVEKLFDVSTLSDYEKTLAFLKDKIREQTGSDIKFFPDGNAEGGIENQEIQLRINYLKYFKEHVFFLPAVNPEDLIWDEEVVKQKLNLEEFESNIETIRSLQNSKVKIIETSKILFGVYNKEAMEDILIKEWVDKEDENYVKIKNIVSLIKGKF